MYLCTQHLHFHTLIPQNYLLSIMACHKSTYVCIKFIYKIVITSSQRWNAAKFVKTLCSQIIEIIDINTVDSDGWMLKNYGKQNEKIMII